MWTYNSVNANCEYNILRNNWAILKWVNFIVCKLSLNRDDGKKGRSHKTDWIWREVKARKCWLGSHLGTDDRWNIKLTFYMGGS